MITTKISKLNGLVALAIILTTIANYTQAVESEHTAELGYDIDIQLIMNQVPRLFENQAVSIKVSSQYTQFSNLNIELQFPEGVHQSKALSSKNTGRLYPQMVYQSDFNFKVLDSGQHKITVKVSGTTIDGDYKDRYAYLRFTVDSDKSKSQMGWLKSNHSTEADQRSNVEKPALQINNDGTITIYDADENLNEISRKVPANFLDNNSSAQVGNTVTISGRYRFRNRENTFYIGYYHNLMRLTNASTGEHLDWTYSDDDGNFVFDPVDNPGVDGMAVHPYTVRYQSGGGYGVCFYPSCEDLAAEDGGSFDSFFSLYSGSFTTGNGNQDIGTFTTEYNFNNGLRPQWIKNDMDETNIHLGLNTNITGSMTAEWSFSNDDHGNHYHSGGNIHFKTDVGDGTNETVLHEIGHNIMWNAGTFPEDSDCPDPHFVTQVSGVQCAWTEGWAYAFANFVNAQPKLCFPPSTTNCIDFEVESSFTYCQGWYCGPNSAQVEGHVIGAIWDLYDSSDDDFDIETYNRSLIYNILETDTNDSFASFWVSWLNDGNSEQGVNSLFQNDIVFGNPYDIRVNNPTVNDSTPNVNQDITVTVSLRNLGDVSSVATNIKFYLSNNSTISSNDQLMATHFRGVLNKNLVVFAGETFSINTVGNFYVGACFDDVYGFDNVPSNNCSSGVPITVTANDVIFQSNFD
jgi:hypothetical protein